MNEFEQTVQAQQEWEMWQVFSKACDEGYPHSFQEFFVDWDIMIDVAKQIRSMRDERV